MYFPGACSTKRVYLRLSSALPHQIIRDFVACVRIILACIVLFAIMKYHHGALIPLHDFSGNTFRHNLVVIVHENNCQAAAG